MFKTDKNFANSQRKSVEPVYVFDSIIMNAIFLSW